MKIGILADTHWGVRNDNPVLLDNFKKFFDTIFFPYIDTHKIQKVIHLGDLVDRRKYTNHLTAHRLRTDFLKPLLERTELHLIAGNHDTHYKTHNKVNAFELLGLNTLPGVYLYTNPTEIVFRGNDTFKALMLPWICPENEQQSFDFIDKTTSQVCFAHLELKGFEMRKGSFSEIGHEANRFSKFKKVFTGHYHYRSIVGNINYVGSPFEITWADYGSIRGFHILDTETLELEFIENPYKMFKKITYTQKGNVTWRPNDYKDTYVKVLVKDRDDALAFDSFLQQLEAVAIDVQILDTILQPSVGNTDINQAESTLDILLSTLNTIDISPHLRPGLNELLRSLYQEANLLQA